ncbi:hypothetical protein SH584_11330 [Sphingomonas sp. LY29]|uniref:hypothetical protein n=1 Tax=Sphingomonas sp. LY29 TaxID=3095341 RepID=UPI002D79E018|nr:hypothetical protein [Sphingomonas sp. LY29]WRP25623.1 hypothetical protein SH584_11330 [Sphingomonas sp. LY29]
MNRAVLRRLGLAVGIAIALAGCDGKPDPLNWTEVPKEPQVYAYVLDQCLRSTTGPAATRYNDWDEAIDECSQAARDASRFCPEGMLCRPDVSVTRADVRRILPAIAAGSGTDETSEAQAQAEGSQSGPKGIAQGIAP